MLKIISRAILKRSSGELTVNESTKSFPNSVGKLVNLYQKLETAATTVFQKLDNFFDIMVKRVDQ